MGPLARRHERLVAEADAACHAASVAWRTRAVNLRALEERAQVLLAAASSALAAIEAERSELNL